MSGLAIKRFGKPEDIAELTAFLASEKAGYITSQVIRIDGVTTKGGPIGRENIILAQRHRDASLIEKIGLVFTSRPAISGRLPSGCRPDEAVKTISVGKAAKQPGNTRMPSSSPPIPSGLSETG